MKIQATVGILTFNSEKTLRKTLESVKDFDDILICDGGSTDETLNIAKIFNARIINQSVACKNSDGTIADFSCVRNQCLDNAKYDWFLYLDSDETIDETLIKEIQEISEKNTGVVVYKISPRIIYDGKLIEYSSNYPGWQNRFFNKKTGARFIKSVHERIDFDKRLIEQIELSGHWHYFVDKDFDMNKLKKYSLMESKMAFLKKDRSVFSQIHQRIKIIFKIFIKSVLNYVFHGFEKTMPIKAELRRIHYNLLTIFYLITKK